MVLIRALTPVIAASSGSAVYLLAGGGEFWAAIIFVMALLPGDAPTKAEPPPSHV